MRKRIKARVKKPKRMPHDFSVEVMRYGSVLTEFHTEYKRGTYRRIRTYRYKGKIYYSVEICIVCCPVVVKECIEL